ncbi:glycoside hydrolase superfamily [Gilbertella persicaria]|uniref:glycoside hydrolase superfamily n=1 Tax=Gilbertella persicaria TaxID=101096 RepID=UPI00221F8FAC|nr:glycoside hydrolase superfamily [Gilbertella persicaria]KAI8058972.1 glycoside hydrolase superfamily [Gilbertella persicaria]
MITWTYLLIALTGIFLVVNASHVQLDKRAGTAYNYWTTKAWGVNLGNWLILEKWMNPSFFEQYASKAKDEWTFCQQASDPAKILKQHWDTWVTEDDFKKLAMAKVNHVRIPVGYWAFIKPDSAEPYIFTGQKAQIQRVLGYCKKYDMYAIIDLHGLPGSQNGNDHSGRSGPIGFYSDYNIKRSLQVVQAVVGWMNGLESSLKGRISAIESANEPHADTDAHFKQLKNYYQQAYKIIQSSSFKVPMLFHDAFKGLDAWKDFLTASANAVIDLHPYYAFPPNKNKTSIIEGICNTKSQAKSFHLPVFFGEWSVASGVSNSSEWLKIMMDTQVSVYKNSGVGGTFWSLKNKINSNVWSFEQLLDQDIISNKTFSDSPDHQC